MGMNCKMTGLVKFIYVTIQALCFFLSFNQENLLKQVQKGN
jgi:hypothetical protein